MTAPYDLRPLVLGIFPMSQGFGWAVFESPFAPVERAIFLSPKGSPDAWLDRADKLMGRFRPQTVVIEAFDPESTDRHAVVKRIGDRLLHLATDRGLAVEVVTRKQVNGAMGKSPDASRRSVALEVASRVPMLQCDVPRARKFGDGENRSMAVFNAAALVLAHYENGATALLDDLRDAA